MALKDSIHRFRLAVGQRITGKRLYGVGKDTDFFAVTQKWGSEYQRYEQLDYYSNVVYACINLLSDAVAQYCVTLSVMKGDQPEELNTHPFLELLDNPQPFEEDGLSKHEFIEAVESFLDLTGEAFIYFSRGKMTGQPKSMYLLRPDKMGVDIDDSGNVQGYFLHNSGGSNVIPFDIEEILHIKLFNPKNPYRGLSPIQAGMDYIDTDNYTTKFTKHFFENNAGLNGVLSINGEVSQNAFAKFVHQWRDKYEGVDNAGKTAIIRESEANFTKVGLGLNELDMAALRNMSRDDVLTIYRVPKPMLGLADETGLGRGNVETLEYIFAKWTIEPKLRRLDAAFQKVVDRFYPDEQLILGHENIIPADKTFDLEERKAAIDVWKTRDEVRDEEGLDPVEGGDVLRVPLNSVALYDESTDGGDTTTNPETPPAVDPAAGKKLTMKIIKRVVVPKKKDSFTINLAHKEHFRLRLMHNQASYERRYKQKMRPILIQQRKEALDNLEAKASGFKKNFIEKLFDDSKYDQLMTEKLSPVMVDLGQEQGALALAFAGDAKDDFRMTAQYQDYVTNSTAKMASNFNDETLAKLNTTLGEGIQNGESLSKLTSRVDSVYADGRGYRNERLARTETLKASNQATLEAYRQTGYVKGIQWYVNPDACEICQEVEGKTVELDAGFFSQGDSVDYGDGESYALNYDDVDAPPLHPNCRCTILPMTELSGDSFINSEDGFLSLGGDTGDNIPAFWGESPGGHSVTTNFLGDAFYVAEDYGTAAQYGKVHELTLPLKSQAIMDVKTNKQYEELVQNAIQHAVDTGGDIDTFKAIPQYIMDLGYKAARIFPAVDPNAGIGIVDPKTIKKVKQTLGLE